MSDMLFNLIIEQRLLQLYVLLMSIQSHQHQMCYVDFEKVCVIIFYQCKLMLLFCDNEPSN